MAGPKSMDVVQAAHAFAHRIPGQPKQFQMYAFLVTVEGMEQCEAMALAYDRPVRHNIRAGCERKEPK